MTSGLLLAIPLLLCLAAQCGCVWNKPVDIQLPEGVKRPDKCVVVLFADGLHFPTLQRMADAGQMPNFKHHMLDRGAVFESAFTVIPSITFAVNVSATTGQFPGHHRITGNHWFDRDTLMLEDYEGILDYQQVDGEYVAPTIYEMVPDLYSVTVLTPVHRGSTRHFADWLSTGLTLAFGTMEQVDALTAYRMNEIGREAAAAGKWPDLIWLYCMGPDHVAHSLSRASPQYEANLRNLDVQLGRIVSGVKQAGVYDRTLLAVYSDHGHTVTDPKLRVNTVDKLRAFGFKVGYRELIRGTYQDRLKVFGQARIVAVDDGNRRTVLSLRVGDEWRARPTLEQIERFGRDFGGPAINKDPRPFWDVLLAELPKGHLAAVRDGTDRVLISDGVGRATVERETPHGVTTSAPVGSVPVRASAPLRAPAETYRYTVVGAADPLGLTSHPPAARLIDGQFHTSQQWLEGTSGSATPDMVAQIVDYFDSSRSGDVVLFSTDGWQFATSNRGGHGSVTRDDMQITLLMAGPGVAPGRRSAPVRIVDLPPTLLDFLGRLGSLAKPATFDGVSRLDVLRRGPTSQPGGY